MDVVVYAPASIGNVSVGFDVLGAAVSPVDGTLLGDRVLVKSGLIRSALKRRVILLRNCQLNQKRTSSTTVGSCLLVS